MPVVRAPVAEVNAYVARLEAAWDAHLAPRVIGAPTVISTFAGCGGSSLGYSMAGFRELLAVEWDDNAVATFRLNFPDVPVYHGDIAALSVEDCLTMTGLQPGELDVLDGSPPCQGFSTAGKRQIDDPRNGLFREYVRLLRGLQPRAFVMENVSGMVKGKMKLVFAEIMRELKASGYVVSARLMNAMYFGVPQSRERMIFVGVRSDLGLTPSHPTARSKPITLREAIGDVEPSERVELSGMSATLYPHIRPGDDGGSAHERLYGRRSYFNTKRLSWDRPSNTIPKMIGHSIGAFAHPDEPRNLAISEIKRAASYPDPFILVGQYQEQWARIGNSVPPLFMRAIAEHLREHVLNATPALHAQAAD